VTRKGVDATANAAGNSANPLVTAAAPGSGEEVKASKSVVLSGCCAIADPSYAVYVA
jgi:hypothetical protein